MVEKILAPDFDLSSLGLNFEHTGFGPAGHAYEFSEQFDGKLFKPYMKKERLGKLCDFAVIHAQTFIPPKQSIIQQQKQAGAVAESDLVTAAIDSEFSVVEEKKTKDNDKGDFRRRNNQTTGSSVHKSKLIA